MSGRAGVPTGGWRSRLTPIWLVGAGIFAVIYLAVNLLYAWSTAPPQLPEVDDPDQVVVFLNPISIIPAEDRIKAKVVVNPPLSYLDDKKLNRSLTVVLASERQTLTYKKGTAALSSDIDIIVTDGSYELYPFDSYETGVAVYATVTGPDGAEESVPVDLVIWGKFAGWKVNPTSSRDPLPVDWVRALDAETQERLGDEAVALLDVSRNGSTMSIVLLLLAAMIVLTGFALVVARAVATRRRRIEATMSSWFAALLFAMVPLRTNMPGAPPIGVWIDFLVFLWVILGLMVALAVFVGSWLRFSPAPDPPGESPNAP